MSDDARWSSVEICGRTADVLVPGEPPFDGAVIFLHDVNHRTIRDDPVFTAELVQRRLPAVCPQGGRGWWLDLPVGELVRDFDESLTPLSFVREHVVAWIRGEWGLVPPTIGLLGIGAGGQGVLQLAYRHPRQFPVAAAISPAVDFHILWGQGTELDGMFGSAEAARQQTATLHVHPLNWPRHQLFVCDPADPLWYDGAERLASKLSSMGIPFEADLETSTGRDGWEYSQAMAGRCVSFLAERLAADRRDSS